MVDHGCDKLLLGTVFHPPQRPGGFHLAEDTSIHATQHSTVRAVDRALEILLCFTRAHGGMTLSDIAKQVNLHKSTVYRLLTSLQVKGFVRKDPESDKYHLGWSVLELLGSMNQTDELSSLALPEMTRLRDLTGETVSLYIVSEGHRLRIQAVESHEPVRNVATVGQIYPLFIGASGKVLLAYIGVETVEQVLNHSAMPPDFDRADLFKQLDAIRADGYAISIQERDAGAAALATPVFGKNQECVAALSVSGPMSRFTLAKMHEHVDGVRNAASFITKLLSH